MSGDTTSQYEPPRRAAGDRPTPGVLVVFGAGRPQLAALAIEAPTQLGRDAIAALGVDDHRLSRRHALLTPVGDALLVRDLASRNGTFVGGECLAADRLVPLGGVGVAIRVGETLLVTVRDVAPFANAAVELAPERVLGPRIQEVWATIARHAQASDVLHVQGETGVGKELAARHFHLVHAQRGAAAPFVAVNCATIPPAIAERLLFGAKKGAYSGADADTDGYLQAADGGTLFLDEIAELPLDVQAKLLRVLETREVAPLGATRARPISVRLVTATHTELRPAVAAGRFRDDLYYRIGRPSIVVPALRERAEDIPWLVRWLVGDAPVKLSAPFVEAVLARPWPGNVRELAIEIATAVGEARAKHADTLEPAHLDADAGRDLADDAGADDVEPSDAPDAARLARALADHGGKVATTARALGMHRNQLRRLIARYNLGPTTTKR